MTDVPPETPLESIAEEVPPTEPPSPEEYSPGDAAASEDTGTVFDAAGNAEQTPRDVAEDEDEDPDA